MGIELPAAAAFFATAAAVLSALDKYQEDVEKNKPNLVPGKGFEG